MARKMNFTADELRTMVTYNPETGEFTDKLGAPLGILSASGYVFIKLGGRMLQATRVAWLYMTGNDPVGLIDHEDFDTQNNKWSNLRELSVQESLRYRRIFAGQAVRMKGVRIAPKGYRYQARISYGGKQHSLGHFLTADEAGHAYNKAAIEHFGDMAVLNPVGRSKSIPWAEPERRKFLNEPMEKRPRRGRQAKAKPSTTTTQESEQMKDEQDKKGDQS